MILLFIFFTVNAAFAECPVFEYTLSEYDSKVDAIQSAFKTVLPDKKTIVYTRVPRGLVLSIDESEFFNKGQVILKPESEKLLDAVICVLSQFDNQCMVESHTDEPIPPNSEIEYDWELTLIRANVIVDYMVLKKKLPARKIFPLGFGEIMPFNDNVANRDFSDRRVDFVIFDYEAKR